MNRIGNKIGKYRITKMIGEGGMATVYEAVHEILGTSAAIKILNPELSYNQKVRDRFLQEAKILATLDHPNITKVLDYDDSVNQLSIVMELLQGEDLSKKIKRLGTPSEDIIIHIFKQAMVGLQYAHSKGIVHRDIKPSNLFITSEKKVKILDFGISKLYDKGPELTQTGTQLGTPVYMSPEQVRTERSIDHRSDIYSLGVSLFFAVEGKPPYNLSTTSQFDILNKIVHEPLPVIQKGYRFLPVITKACAKNKEERYQQCNEFRIDLENLKIDYIQPEIVIDDKTIIFGKRNVEIVNESTIIEEIPKNESIPVEDLPKIDKPPTKFSKYDLIRIAAIGLVIIGFVYIVFYFEHKRRQTNLHKDESNRFIPVVNRDSLVSEVPTLVVDNVQSPKENILVIPDEKNEKLIPNKTKNLTNISENNKNTLPITIIPEGTKNESLKLESESPKTENNIPETPISEPNVIQSKTPEITKLEKESNTSKSILLSNEVKINQQIWMTSNVDADKFRNGDAIRQATTDAEWAKAGQNEEPAWRYYKDKSYMNSRYGKLYNWFAVNDKRGICPIGWHVASDADWTVLEETLGGYRVAGGNLKKADSMPALYPDSQGKARFSVELGGWISINGSFQDLNVRSYFWTSSSSNKGNAFGRMIDKEDQEIFREKHDKRLGFFVRCIRD